MEQQRREALVPLLQDPHEQVRQAATEALAQLDQRGHADQLLEHLARGSSQQKISALFGLEAVESDAVRTAVCGALKDDEADVRAVAVQVVGRKRYPAALNDLVNCLQDRHPAVAVYAAQALAHYKDARLVPYFETIYRRGDEELQCACLKALGEMGFAAAEACLLEALSSGSATVRAAAATALGQLVD
ncbi:HEAT repeat domain-containing protein [Desulfuromonas acetoxidans]|uniref:HEAT domain protein n=1 Tax=Desulfuromonas acetoxidans (strain DSM 684 / 11070) TaxID=281689 RepID=Q1K4D6_DESA6|nr:HEAT repeat domain-containing protein [Desulfuromonas acetoxidans]EAT17167.1 HEAT domain protein [Desulfuromonas acetoxidans DSM 684]MBF0646321.1 HEAT repeat domain-containing protein [Desulfuromonas acetoxidans]NVD24246.1 HEAT repeat domain-containing protein [Desulfuromonas acetoxidans]NVE14981.1 HEAT repeat domain-containing protein [Desulfuromonas acetoxidans]